MIINANNLNNETHVRDCEQCGNSFSFVAPFGTHELSLKRVCDDCKLGRAQRECRQCKCKYVKSLTNGALTKYCSVQCRDAFKQDSEVASYRAKTIAAEKKVKKCECCVAEFVAEHGLKKYCETCAPAMRGKQKVACQDCGVQFVAGSNKAKRCVPCRIKAEQARKARVRSERSKREHGAVDVEWTQRLGTAGELIFDLLCARNGWQSAKSIYDTNPGWDRLLMRDGITSRVQVKAVSSTRKTEGELWMLFRTERPVTKATCDIAAVVDIDTADVWLIDVEVLPLRGIYPTEWDHAKHSALGIDGPALAGGEQCNMQQMRADSPSACHQVVGDTKVVA